jgi:hypothetical protein
VMYTAMHALATAALWMIGGSLVLIVAAHVWGWLNMRDPAEFWMQKQYALEETQSHAAYRNQDVTFSDYEAQPFALDPKDAV